MTADELTARGALERTPLETIAFAAWVNCPPDKIPPEYRQHTCEATMIAWRRVVAALTAALAASPEGQALIREAEAVKWPEGATEMRFGSDTVAVDMNRGLIGVNDWAVSFYPDEAQRIGWAMIAAAAAHRNEETPE